MENKDKKGLIALIDEKIAEKAKETAKATEDTKKYKVVNAFSADFLKKVTLKDTSQINNLTSTKIQEDSAVDNLTIEDLTKITHPSSAIPKTDIKYRQPSILETPNYDFIEVTNSVNSSEIKQKNKSKKKFRAKLALITYSIIFLICTCWTVASEIYLSNTARDITMINSQIKEIQYIIKIEQLDSYKDGESSLINNIIEINPPALVQPTQIQPQTNWFDRFCTWLTGLFR